MSMKKHGWLTILTALVLALGCIGTVCAEVIPPDEPGQQIGYVAVVLCEELSLREKPSTSSKALHTLHYGDRPIVVGADAPTGPETENGFVYCTLGETEHPFTDSTNKWDVRITTHYHEEDPFTSMYSVIHEGGHALYELDVRDDLQFTCLAGGVTMGIHESQSRFYENIIGRSRAFCTPLLKILKDVFPEQTGFLTEEELYSAINLSKPSLIRTDADELTYPLHVMIRYEIEKAMISGDLAVKDIPGEWNRLYREVLGVEVPDDRRGCLQDSHWSFGGMGYFPSYALGSAYGAQMLREMEKTVDVWGTVARGDLSPVTAWLTEKIHQYGTLKKPQDLLPAAMGGPLDPAVYTGYLKKKYSELYGL